MCPTLSSLPWPLGNNIILTRVHICKQTWVHGSAVTYNLSDSGQTKLPHSVPSSKERGNNVLLQGLCEEYPGGYRESIQHSAWLSKAASEGHLWVGYLASEVHAGLWIVRLLCSQAFFSGLGFSILLPIRWMVLAGTGSGLWPFLCRQVSREHSKKSWQKPNESENHSKTTKLLGYYFSKMWNKHT